MLSNHVIVNIKSYYSKYRNVPTFSDRQVWAGSTLFAIPAASFGCITLRKSHLVQLLG